MNNIWSFNNQQTNQQQHQQSIMNQFQQSQFLLLQQQLQQQAAILQQQQQQPKFSSSFSVNNLLGNNSHSDRQQQQIAAAVLTQHILANLRQQQFNKMPRPDQSAFQQPIKRQRLNEAYEYSPVECSQNISTSICSISSPSSSSTVSISLDNSCLNNSSERNSPDVLSTSSASSTSSSYKNRRKRQLSIDFENVNCPICGLVLSGLCDMRAHFDFELKRLDNDFKKTEIGLTNETKSPRYMKYIEIKENRQKRLLTKTNLRLRHSTKETNKKSINKREFDDIDQSSAGSDLNTKRIKLINGGSSTDEISDIDEDDELINVVDNDDEDNRVEVEEDEEAKEQFSDEFEEPESVNSSSMKCLTCLQNLKNAFVSINCWHVNCKQCWSKCLNEKKICPQCSTGIKAKDLRRIFL